MEELYFMLEKDMQKACVHIKFSKNVCGFHDFFIEVFFILYREKSEILFFQIELHVMGWFDRFQISVFDHFGFHAQLTYSTTNPSSSQ